VGVKNHTIINIQTSTTVSILKQAKTIANAKKLT